MSRSKNLDFFTSSCDEANEQLWESLGLLCNASRDSENILLLRFKNWDGEFGGNVLVNMLKLVMLP